MGTSHLFAKSNFSLIYYAALNLQSKSTLEHKKDNEKPRHHNLEKKTITRN